jgi:hypothetical protein
MFWALPWDPLRFQSPNHRAEPPQELFPTVRCNADDVCQSQSVGFGNAARITTVLLFSPHFHCNRDLRSHSRCSGVNPKGGADRQLLGTLHCGLILLRMDGRARDAG